MESVFDVSNIDLNSDIDTSGLEIPDPTDIHSHLKDLLEGNLGKLKATK